MKRLVLCAMLFTVPASAARIFTLDQFVFSQSATGGAVLPDSSLMNRAYNEQGWNLFVAFFIPGYTQNLNFDWVVGPGEEIKVEYGFHVDCPAPFTAKLALMGTYGTGQTMETFTTNNGDVRLNVDILPGISGTQVFQGASIELLAEVPEPAFGWSIGILASLIWLVPKRSRKPAQQEVRR